MVSAVLETDYCRQMGFGGDRERIRSSVHLQPSTVETSGNAAATGFSQAGPVDAGDPGSCEQRCCRDSAKWDILRGILLPLFLSNEKGRLMETDPQPERAQSPHKMRQISHGNTSFHPPMHHARGLDVQPGSKRRLSACAYSPGAPEVPPVCVQKRERRIDNISVEGPPVWALDRSTSVHKDDSPISRADTLQRPCFVPVHRRHVREQQGEVKSPSSQRAVSMRLDVRGFHYKPGQISPAAHSGHDTFGGQNPVGSGAGHPATAQVGSVNHSGKTYANPRLGNSAPILEVYWANDSMHAHDPKLFVSDTSIDAPSAGPLSARGGFVEQTDSDGVDLPAGGDSILDCAAQFGTGSPVGSPVFKPHNIHRCISPRLGGSVSGSNLLGSMVNPGREQPHQSAGNESSLADPAMPREAGAGSIGIDLDGQYHSGGLPDKRRRHALENAECVSQRNNTLVFGPIDKDSVRTCAGGRQCSSGCIVAAMANGLQGHVPERRVVSRPGDSKSDLPEVGHAVNRLICHGAEQEALHLLQSHAPPRGGTNPCDGPTLGQRSGVCLSPDGTNAEMHPQSNERGGRSHSHHALVAEKRLVPHAHGHADRTTHNASRVRAVVNRPTGCTAPRPRDPPVNRLEGLGRSLQASGVSDAVAATIEAAHRPSTRALYQTKWRFFRVWCNRRNVNPVHPPVVTVLKYLQHLLSVPIKVATILTHISALSACCDPIEGTSIGCQPLIKAWVKGAKALNPRVRTLMPAWSLPVVLSALREPPYEPMAKAELKYVTLKTIFLIAITSARRISELQALCMREPFLILNPASALLRVNNAFLPKVASDLALNADIELQAFYPKPKGAIEKEQRKNCPIRALKYYLQATAEIRGDNTSLFVAFMPKSAGSPVSKRVMSTWLTEVIRKAYHTMGHEDPVLIRANPHSLRGVASTYAELALVSPSEICRAATWSSYCMFSRVYRLDSLAKGNFGAAVLRTASEANLRT